MDNITNNDVCLCPDSMPIWIDIEVFKNPMELIEYKEKPKEEILICDNCSNIVIKNGQISVKHNK